jgi:hypothetical protein
MQIYRAKKEKIMNRTLAAIKQENQQNRYWRRLFKMADALLLAICILVGAGAHAATITRDFSGAWYDPARSGQGIELQIIQQGTSKSALVHWFTFDQNGNPEWLVGVAPITSGASVTVPLSRVRGPKFVEPASNSSVQSVPWGQLTLRFDDCNSGQMSFSGSFGSGTVSMSRITQGFGSQCTGTLADDLGQSASTLSDDRRMDDGSNGASGIEGYARYSQRPGRADFKVELSNAPVGSYQVFVADVMRGSLVVTQSAAGLREGELEFRSPPEPGHLALDFDPRGQTVSVRQGSTVILTTRVLDSGNNTGGGNSGGGNSGGGNSGGSGTTSSPGSLVAVGPDRDAFGTLRYEVRPDRTRFDIEIENIDNGSYDVFVAGTNRGTITVTLNQGEVEFRTPAEAGHPALNFDPRGQVVEIRKAGVVYLRGTAAN